MISTAIGLSPTTGVYDRIDPYWIDFELVLVPLVRKWKWRMWSDHGVEFFIHPAMQATPEMGFPGVLSTGSGRATARRDSGGEGGKIMIKSDAQRERTVAQIEGFRQALAKVDEEKPDKRSAAIRGSYESMIRQLEDELREYDQLKSGEVGSAARRAARSNRTLHREDPDCQGRFANRIGAAFRREQAGDQPL